MDLRSIFHVLTPKDNADKEMYVYNSKTRIYENKGRETLKAKIAIVLGTRNREYYANATIYDIAVRTYVERKELTMPIHFLPLKNGKRKSRAG